MLGRLIVLRRVLIFGGVATPDFSASQTEPQVDPCITYFHALFASVLVGFRNLDLICVLAIHVLPSSLRSVL
jgi:hypothetical protein